jgi:hypothetical protein
MSKLVEISSQSPSKTFWIREGTYAHESQLPQIFDALELVKSWNTKRVWLPQEV